MAADEIVLVAIYSVSMELSGGELVETVNGPTCQTDWKVDPRTSCDIYILEGNLTFLVHRLPSRNPKTDDAAIFPL